MVLSIISNHELLCGLQILKGVWGLLIQAQTEYMTKMTIPLFIPRVSLPFSILSFFFPFFPFFLLKNWVSDSERLLVKKSILACMFLSKFCYCFALLLRDWVWIFQIAGRKKHTGKLSGFAGNSPNDFPLCHPNFI